MIKILIILVIAFSFEAMGVITIKKGLDQIGPRYTERKATTPLLLNVLKLVGDWFANKNVLLGLLLETIFFAQLQYLLGQRDVSFVWPLTAISFVMTALAAKFFLHERVDAARWTGVALIILGAMFIGYSEHVKPKDAPLPAAGDVKAPPE
ncbi:MAG: EamA family transporter [Verrucomicrobiia bacterium]